MLYFHRLITIKLLFVSYYLPSLFFYMNALADRKFSDKNVQIIMVNLANFLQENTSPNSCDNINKMLFKRYQLFWKELSLKLEAFYVSIL